MFYQVSADPVLKFKNIEDIYTTPKAVTVNRFDDDGVKLFKENFEKALNSNQSIIPIVIDSYGGKVHSLLAMVDIIKSSPIPVATIVSGKAMSCGAILFTCGADEHRYIGPYGTVMIHDVSCFTCGKIEDLKVDVKETNRLNKIVYKLMAKNCGKSSNYFLDIIKSKGNRDWFLTPEDCIKHNIANKIGSPTFKIKIKAEVSFGC